MLALELETLLDWYAITFITYSYMIQFEYESCPHIISHNTFLVRVYNVSTVAKKHESGATDLVLLAVYWQCTVLAVYWQCTAEKRVNV